MTKLINAYKAKPTTANLDRLLRYLMKHPMAIVMATDEELDFFRNDPAFDIVTK